MVWALLKYRLSSVYLDRLKESLIVHVRNEDWHKASRFEGKIDAVREFVEITERLAKEIEGGRLDVDIALGVIENKAREKIVEGS